MTGNPDAAQAIVRRIRRNHNPHAQPLAATMRGDIRRREVRRNVRLRHKYDDREDVHFRPLHFPVAIDGVVP